jgi:hypothetical protein
MTLEIAVAFGGVFAIGVGLMVVWWVAGRAERAETAKKAGSPRV